MSFAGSTYEENIFATDFAALKQLYTNKLLENLLHIDNRYDTEWRKATMAKDGDNQIYNKKHILAILSYMALNDIWDQSTTPSPIIHKLNQLKPYNFKCGSGEVNEIALNYNNSSAYYAKRRKVTIAKEVVE
ncbi:4370_t:CDS:2 [Scutellospora calospora]|uniref:4370_t:CDS:1 n=1 Tax=Scutellospora calospora TaxID=85575 RepID=A0ACA9KU26_9GLOM|nr:4370_t:CDS:2 [Scutellospora calospora]